MLTGLALEDGVLRFWFSTGSVSGLRRVLVLDRLGPRGDGVTTRPADVLDHQSREDFRLELFGDQKGCRVQAGLMRPGRPVAAESSDQKVPVRRPVRFLWRQTEPGMRQEAKDRLNMCPHVHRETPVVFSYLLQLQLMFSCY